MQTEFYLCPPLLGAYESTLKLKVVTAGRGTGKTTYLGWEMYDCFSGMPKSLGAFTGPTYAMLLSKIFPSAKKVLKGMGLKEDRPGQPGHFVMGRKPPKHFKTPYNEPDKYEYVITLFNGASLEFVSQDRPDSVRGASYDYHLNDEATLMKRGFHDSVLIPTLRGNRRYFGKHPKHGMRVYVGSQANTQEGYWVEDQHLLKDERGDFMRDLQGNLILDESVYHVRAASHANIAVLGQEVLDLWKKTLPPMIYEIEVLSNRPQKIEHGFYPGFDSSKHTYMGGYEYGYDKQSEFGVYVRNEDSDRDRKRPLLLAADFNAIQNTLLVAQERKSVNSFECKLLNEFYTAGNQSVETWLKPFVAFYKDQVKKVLYVYGDPGGNKIANMDVKSLFEKMADYLREHGWVVNIMVRGRAYPNHKMKHSFLNDLMNETNSKLPVLRIHYHRCKWLITSIENTPIKPNFEKDKSSERQDIDQRGATHGGDTLDYLLWYRYRYPNSGKSKGNKVRIGGNPV